MLTVTLRARSGKLGSPQWDGVRIATWSGIATRERAEEVELHMLAEYADARVESVVIEGTPDLPEERSCPWPCSHCDGE